MLSWIKRYLLYKKIIFKPHSKLLSIDKTLRLSRRWNLLSKQLNISATRVFKILFLNSYYPFAVYMCIINIVSYLHLMKWSVITFKDTIINKLKSEWNVFKFTYKYFGLCLIVCLYIGRCFLSLVSQTLIFSHLF